jgi:potassium-transporting ATPase KdpC subunit
MLGIIVSSFRAVIVVTVITGFLYPAMITLLSVLFFPEQASGSLWIRNGRVVGSRLIAQDSSDPKYFWYRPSASGFSANPSGASNLSPSSKEWLKTVEERKLKYGANAPVDLLMASGSGLDPDISPASAVFQLSRIAEARKLDVATQEKLRSWISQLAASSRPMFGPSALNVMDLNRYLDDLLR